MQTAGIVRGQEAANVILEGVKTDIMKAPQELVLAAYGESGCRA